MKLLLFISLLYSFSLRVFSQTAFQNEGIIQMHENANIGFHTHFINNGKFDENKGTAGFYNNNETLAVSGTNKAVFNDVEIGVFNNLELQTSLGVTNKLFFLEGKVLTPRNNPNVSLEFLNHYDYYGADDKRYTDGYALVTNTNEFTFPIGDDERLRPMILPKQLQNNTFKGAYFFDNPLNFNTNFTENKESSIQAISKQEFWDFEGVTETSITLTWDEQSNIASLVTSIKNLRVVGWHKTLKVWENLGNVEVTGNLERGKITSNSFLPNIYEIITIGSFNEKAKGNYLISPNKDNVNDNLIVEEIVNYKHNRLSIYNRWGLLVYRVKDYKDEFRGISEARATFFASKGLPEGSYFYIVEYGDTTKLGKQQKGWIYINR